jgi:predicted amidohydrolase
MGEDRWLRAGDRLCLAQTPWGAAGLAICYDLRVPELFRAYALQGAVLILLVAQWPAARQDHWRTLIRARAIENQLFVAAVNRTGTSKDEAFGGGSLVVDPWGAVVAEAGDQETLLSAEIDLERVAQVRRQMPVLQDRRPEVYET